MRRAVKTRHRSSPRLVEKKGRHAPPCCYDHGLVTRGRRNDGHLTSPRGMLEQDVSLSMVPFGDSLFGPVVSGTDLRNACSTLAQGCVPVTTRRTCFGGMRLSQLQCLQSITSISFLISHLSSFISYPLLFSQQYCCIFSFQEQMASSWFSYDLSRPYPYRWFTPVSLCGGTLFLALFTWLNFAANGFELRRVIVSIK